MLDGNEILEINAWAKVLEALGQSGHDKAHANQEILREITVIAKKRLELLSKSDETNQ